LRTQNAQGGPIVIPEGTWQIDDDLTFSVPVKMYGTLNIAAGKTMTFASSSLLDALTAGSFSGTGSLTFAAGSSAELPESRQVFGAGLTVTFANPPTLRPEQFGAVGDSDKDTGGGTADTEAIQRAINVVQAAGGGKVKFGAKAYRTSTLTFYPHTYLEGEGMDSTWIVNDFDTDGIKLDQLTDTSYKFFGIRDLTLTGTLSASTGDGIDITRVSGVNQEGHGVIENVFVKYFNDNFYLGEPMGIRLKNCRSTNSTAVGFHVVGDATPGNSSAGNEFENCQAIFLGTHGFFFENLCYVDLYSCYAERAGQGAVSGNGYRAVGVDAAGSSSPQLGFFGCYSEQSLDEEIYLKFCKNITMNRCFVFPSAANRDSVSIIDSRMINIIACEVLTVPESGYASFYFGEETGTMQVTVIGSRFYNYRLHSNGISFLDFINCYVLSQGITMSPFNRIHKNLHVMDGDLTVVNFGTLAGESLTNGVLTGGASWTAVDDFALAADAATYTHSAGSGTLTQASGTLAIAGIGGGWYKFQYTISGVTAGATATLTTAFASETIDLPIKAGTSVVYFKAAAAPGDFVISVTSTAGGFTIDTLSCKQAIAGNAAVHGKLLGAGTAGVKVQSDGDTTLDGNLEFSYDAWIQFKNSGGSLRNVLQLGNAIGSADRVQLESQDGILEVNSLYGQNIICFRNSDSLFYLIGTSATALATTKNSPQQRLSSAYWTGAANATRNFSFQNLMVDTTPTYIYSISSDALANILALRQDGNVGINTINWGTTAAKVLAVGAGTAPTTTPADITQVWVADIGGAAGKASMHMMSESGTGSQVVVGALIKTDTGDPAQVHEGIMCINTFDNTVRIYADGAWRTIASGW